MKGIALLASLLVFACVTMYFSGFLVLYALMVSGNISHNYGFFVHFTANVLQSCILFSLRVGRQVTLIVNVVTF